MLFLLRRNLPRGCCCRSFTSTRPRITIPSSASSRSPSPSLPIPSRTDPFRQTRGHRTGATARKMTSRETLPSSPIRVLRSVASVRRWRDPLTDTRRTVGLVPTMGALHDGHLSLIRAAARDNHHVVVSIYVNPAQFGRAEDLDSYPATWDADVAKLTKLDRELADDGGNLGRVTAVFAPTTADMYPAGFPGQDVDSKGSFVTITPVGEVLEGKSRPTFFRGVATVCMKLFNIVQPTRVYFGQKDVQQTVVIRRMVRDLMLPAEVVVCPTERDPVDGLALSSRNVYLGSRRRAVAPALFQALSAGETMYRSAGCLDRKSVLGTAEHVINGAQLVQEDLRAPQRALFDIDYMSLADPDTMMEIDEIDPDKGAVLSGAIKMDPVEKPADGEDVGFSGGPPVRLIDNIILKPRAEYEAQD